jgi:putative spermidine/putrescine transport system permease protein
MSQNRQRRPLPAGCRAIPVLARMLPLLLFFTLTVGVGLFRAASRSLTAGSEPWQRLVSTGEVFSSLRVTFTVAAVSALGSTVLGAAGAYLLWRAPRPLQRLGQLYRLPVILPHLAVAFLTMVIWARTGIISALLLRLGIISDAREFPALLFGAGPAGIILAYLYKGFPFVMLMASGVLRRVPQQLLVTARMLGAGPVRIALTVVLPLLGPILLQSGTILFLYALGGFEIPWLLGGSRPRLVPVMAYSLYFQGTAASQELAMAILTALALFALLWTAVVVRWGRYTTPWELP